MIEFKNATKIYKSKKGTSTTALNDINLKIGNKGMIFVVGKSGSGKSTLLNLLGGLDNLTSGDILINKMSISKFSKKQYDCYRNTYVGFVFQEFNILEQYNVYENIELALKLQNQKTSRDIIDNILNKLGLDGLGTRKTNELSGGQKQRVAIARALIKKPQIILADEPTGNLDKNSSEQIFNILKEISKEQLVIVVSHDMESANKYADGIIQIDDGKIISAYDNKDEVENNSFELKKSKLPFTYALKMAFTSFKVRPFKLFMTIILTAVSLIFMGFTVNCAIFDKTMLIVDTMKNNDNYIYDVHNRKNISAGEIISLPLTENDIKNIENITSAKINPIYTLYDNGKDLIFEFGKNNQKDNYYKFELNYTKFIEINDSRILGKLIGKEPINNNEIVVHKYFADYAIKYGIMTPSNNLYFPKSYDELVNSKQEIKLGENKVIITGIIDEDDSLFAKAKETGVFENRKLELYFYSNYVNKAYNIYNHKFVESAVLRSNKYSFLDKINIRNHNLNESGNYLSSNIKALDEKINIITTSGLSSISSLEKNETILSIDGLRAFDNEFDTKLNKYLQLHSGGKYEDLLTDFVTIYLKENTNFLKPYLSIYVNNIEKKEINILGISLDDNSYISYKYIEEYEPILKKMDSVKIFDNDTNNLTKSLNKIVFRNDVVNHNNPYYSFSIDNDGDIYNIITTYEQLAIYILFVSLVFVLFTFLLFSNFIGVSISYYKKEIGILRALGATRNDIVKVFAYESLIIGIIAWIVSIVGWFTLCNILNQSIFGNMYYTLNGIITHPLVPIIMLAFTIFIALFITSISISRITNIKPIDAILNK